MKVVKYNISLIFEREVTIDFDYRLIDSYGLLGKVCKCEGVEGVWNISPYQIRVERAAYFSPDKVGESIATMVENEVNKKVYPDRKKDKMKKIAKIVRHWKLMVAIVLIVAIPFTLIVSGNYLEGIGSMYGIIFWGAGCAIFILGSIFMVTFIVVGLVQSWHNEIFTKKK